jgi:hypothetical protein
MFRKFLAAGAVIIGALAVPATASASTAWHSQGTVIVFRDEGTLATTDHVTQGESLLALSGKVFTVASAYGSNPETITLSPSIEGAGPFVFHPGCQPVSRQPDLRVFRHPVQPPCRNRHHRGRWGW